MVTAANSKVGTVPTSNAGSASGATAVQKVAVKYGDTGVDLRHTKVTGAVPDPATLGLLPNADYTDALNKVVKAGDNPQLDADREQHFDLTLGANTKAAIAANGGAPLTSDQAAKVFAQTQGEEGARDYAILGQLNALQTTGQLTDEPQASVDVDGVAIGDIDIPNGTLPSALVIAQSDDPVQLLKDTIGTGGSAALSRHLQSLPPAEQKDFAQRVLLAMAATAQSGVGRVDGETASTWQAQEMPDEFKGDSFMAMVWILAQVTDKMNQDVSDYATALGKQNGVLSPSKNPDGSVNNSSTKEQNTIQMNMQILSAKTYKVQTIAELSKTIRENVGHAMQTSAG